MAAAGGLAEPAALARWLYRFGTVPRGADLDRDFGPDDDPMAVIGMTVGGRARRRIEPSFEATSLPGWYSFARRGAPALVSAACKLYVSPRPEALAAAFPILAEAFVRAGVRSFKVGRGVEGLLRPDKIIAYFDDHADLAAVARALCRRLTRCPAQGVPFTTQIDGSGLLSLGVDPPLGDAATSWRAWVTRRLAASLAASRGALVESRVAEALAEIRAAGVDPESWTPAASAFGAQVAR